MNLFKRGGHLFSIQVLMSLLYCAKSCNFGPANLGLFNFGVGNVGFFNFGAGNAGIGNKGFANGGALNTGFAQLGVRNIGALNVAPIPNTISVLNIPVGPNLTPPLPGIGRRRRRRSTMIYPEGKFPWLLSASESSSAKNSHKAISSP